MDSERMEDEVVYEKGYTKVILRRYTDKKGSPQEWGMVHVNSRGKGALVAALTEAGELILERSLRVPMKREVIELPGGLNDMDHETPLSVAKRELLEETGYTAEDYQEVAHLADAPGITDQETVLFIARNAEKVTAPSLGDSEEVTVLTIPLDEVRSFLRHSEYPVDAKVYAALAFLEPN